MTAPAPPAEPPPPLPLTVEQQAEAAKLYRAVVAERDAGRRHLLVTFDGDRITIRATLERRDIALIKNHAKIVTTS